MSWLEDYIAGIMRNGIPKEDATKHEVQNKLPEEEQQEYVDRGGVMPIAGTNDSYARQRRNGNREPVKRNADEAQPSVEPVANSAGTVAETKAAGEASGTAANGSEGEGTVLAPKDEAFKSPYEKVNENAKKNDAAADGEKKGAEDTDSKKARDAYFNVIDEVTEALVKKANEHDGLTEEDKKKIAKAAKRKMLLAGIGDLGHTIHNAYWAARGEKNPHGEQEKPSDKAKKEIREDWDWLDKKESKRLEYLLKAAELQKTAAGLKNQEDMMNWRNAEQARKEKKQLWDMQREQGKLDIEKEKLKIQRDLADGRISKMQHDMLMDELELQDKLQRTAIAQQNADRLAQGSTTTTTETDITGIPTTKTTVKQVGTAGSTGNSNAGGSGKKKLPNSGKRQLP